jgi:hypothetical protein
MKIKLFVFNSPPPVVKDPIIDIAGCRMGFNDTVLGSLRWRWWGLRHNGISQGIRQDNQRNGRYEQKHQRACTHQFPIDSAMHNIQFARC